MFLNLKARSGKRYNKLNRNCYRTWNAGTQRICFEFMHYKCISMEWNLHLCRFEKNHTRYALFAFYNIKVDWKDSNPTDNYVHARQIVCQQQCTYVNSKNCCNLDSICIISNPRTSLVFHPLNGHDTRQWAVSTIIHKNTKSSLRHYL